MTKNNQQPIVPSKLIKKRMLEEKAFNKKKYLNCMVLRKANGKFILFTLNLVIS